MNKKVFLSGFSLLCATVVLAQEDSAQIAAEIAGEGPWHALGLGIILISFSLVIFAVFTVLVILILAAISIFLALVAAGVVSAATLYGFQKRSVSAGVRALMWISIPSVAGVVGWITLYVFNGFFDWHIPTDYVVLLGLGGGFLGGMLLTFMLIKIGQRLLSWMMNMFLVSDED